MSKTIRVTVQEREEALRSLRGIADMAISEAQGEKPTIYTVCEHRSASNWTMYVNVYLYIGAGDLRRITGLVADAGLHPYSSRHDALIVKGHGYDRARWVAERAARALGWFGDSWRHQHLGGA